MIFILLIVWSTLSDLRAQPRADYKEMLYHAFVTNDAEKAKSAVELLEESYDLNQTVDLLYELTYAQQTVLGYEIEEEYFVRLYDKAKINSKKLILIDTLKSYGHTFLASIYAIQMGRSTMSAMFLAPKNKAHLKLALEADDTNPVAWMQYGGFKFYAPGFFGGDLDDAIESFEKSIKFFEEQENELTFNWDYLGTLNLLRTSYKKSGRKADAQAIKMKAKSIEPRLTWVKN